MYFCELCLALFVLRGAFSYLCRRYVITGVVQRYLFSAWRYLALFGFAGVAGRSCTLPFANALSVLLLLRFRLRGVAKIEARCHSKKRAASTNV